MIKLHWLGVLEGRCYVDICLLGNDSNMNAERASKATDYRFPHLSSSIAALKNR